MRDPKEIYAEFMQSLGIPLDNHGVDTPRRVADFFKEFTRGERDPDFVATTFLSSISEKVEIGGVKFYSLCSHHHLPFFGTVDVEYVPNGRIIGLSKVPRIVAWLAAKPTIQEDLTRSICGYLYNAITPSYIVVKIKATHMCMSMRVNGCDDCETTTTYRMDK